MSRLEKTCLRVLLGVTALACVALAMPDLVIIGFFLLLLPGLILVISPPIALYGWLFAAPYAGLRTFGFAWWGAIPVALLVPLAFAF